MAETANTAWYRQGTVSITNGTTKVTGVGTHFTTAGINPGATLRIDDRPYAYEVASVVSDTEIQLARTYYGGTVSAASYSIDRNFQSTTNARLAADVSDLVGIYEDVRDGVYLTIEGKSAYQVAVKNGYTGTEAQWIESLKAANEWQTLNNRTEILTHNGAAAHNALFRGKNLGTAITAAQIAAIRDGTFADLYPGDHWTLTIDGTEHYAIVLGFNIMRVADEGNGARRNHAAVRLSEITRQINPTGTCAGHILNSELYKTTFPAFLTKLEAVVGAGNIVPFTDHVADSIDDDGNVNHRTTVNDCKLFMASYMNITGNNRNMANMGWEFAGQIQLPYYRHNNGASSGRTSENMNATRWYSIINSERILTNYAPNTESYAACAVYPIFLLG